MNLEFHLKIAGCIFLGFAVVHFFFPKRFHWKEELHRLSLLNRQIFWVHCGFIVLILLMFSFLCLVGTSALLEHSFLTHIVLSGLAIFSFSRLFAQFFVYDSSLWKGHALYTKIHIVFVVCWSYLVLIFGWAIWSC